MSAALPAVVGALLLGALNTFGDFVWARFISSHRAVFGLVHGTLLLMAVGLYLGVLRGRPAFGAVAGATVGLLAAASFYALAPLLGYSAMFVSWMALWIGFAFLDARLHGGAAPRETLLAGRARGDRLRGRVLGDLGHLAAAGARRPALRLQLRLLDARLPARLPRPAAARPARAELARPSCRPRAHERPRQVAERVLADPAARTRPPTRRASG